VVELVGYGTAHLREATFALRNVGTGEPCALSNKQGEISRNGNPSVNRNAGPDERQDPPPFCMEEPREFS
jgi:hypothetical protein